MLLAPLPLSLAMAAVTAAAPVTLFLGGDVMTGRAIDQVLAHSVDPALHEPWVRSARTYVELAEQASGPVPEPVEPSYPWGEALDVLADRRPAVRIINLETAITAGGTPWPDKGIHYRMHPANVSVLQAAELDCCVLANNHVLDWGRPELATTLDALHGAGLATAGAGAHGDAALEPAVLPLPDGGRVLVFALGHPSSGIPPQWRAGAARAGVALLATLDPDATPSRHLFGRIAASREPGDVVVASIHWGDNWGYDIPAAQIAFAHALVDEAGVDVVHGHSSHHPRAIEVHRGRPILYGCGDLLNDYEGIGGHEAYRPELTLMVFPRLGPDRRLRDLVMVPMHIARLQLHRATAAQAAWLADTMDRECSRFGGAVAMEPDSTLSLRW